MPPKMRLRSKTKRSPAVSQRSKPPVKKGALTERRNSKKSTEKKLTRSRPSVTRRRKKSESESEESSLSDSDSFEDIIALNESRPYTRPKSRSTESDDRDSTTAEDLEIHEEWLCGICDKEVRYDDDGILCEAACDRWFHRQCVKLTKMAYQLLQKEISAEWACDGCIATGKVKQRRKGLKP